MTEWAVTVKITATPTYTQITAASLLIRPANCAFVLLGGITGGVLGILANYTAPIKLFNCTVGLQSVWPSTGSMLQRHFNVLHRKSSAVPAHTICHFSPRSFLSFVLALLYIATSNLPSVNVPYRQVCRIYLIGFPSLSFSSFLLKFNVCLILWISVYIFNTMLSFLRNVRPFRGGSKISTFYRHWAEHSFSLWLSLTALPAGETTVLQYLPKILFCTSEKSSSLGGIQILILPNLMILVTHHLKDSCKNNTQIIKIIIIMIIYHKVFPMLLFRFL